MALATTVAEPAGTSSLKLRIPSFYFLSLQVKAQIFKSRYLETLQSRCPIKQVSGFIPSKFSFFASQQTYSFQLMCSSAFHYSCFQGHYQMGNMFNLSHYYKRSKIQAIYHHFRSSSWHHSHRVFIFILKRRVCCKVFLLEERVYSLKFNLFPRLLLQIFCKEDCQIKETMLAPSTLPNLF